MSNLKSQFLINIQARGFINDATNLKALDDIMANKQITAYIGFDCTAASLHVGSLIQLMVLRHLVNCNHKIIILLGGGTTKIGDPSGKDKSRQLIDEKAINDNLDGIKNCISQFIDLNNPNVAIINNDDWLKNLNYIEFLRDVGSKFSVNNMLNFESVKQRLDRSQNLSFLEFNYMILQAYDFYFLNKNHDCILQIGGSDQWGNIVNGIDLTRRLFAQNNQEKEIFGLTTPLLTTKDGKKMGKTASGAIWLDKNLLSSFDYFQFWRNIDDIDVERFLKFFTDLDLGQIKELSQLKDQNINKAKEILAFQAVKIAHGQDLADDSLNKAQNIFKNNSLDNIPTKIVNFDNKILANLLKDAQIVSSASEVRRLIKGGGLKINDQKITNINYQISDKDLIKGNFFKVALGKKNIFKIQINK